MNFEFATAARVIFGRGVFEQAPGLVKTLGSRLLVVTGKRRSRAQTLLDRSGEGLIFSISREPTIDDVRKGAALAREGGIEVVAGIGGGSAMDAAKAIAVLAANPGDVLDYLEVIGQGKALARPGLPCIAIPTTAGSGAEVTRNAVLHSPEHRVKASLRGPFLLPRIALIDPELTDDLPPALTASTGLDALTQLIEPFISIRANPFTDAFCREGLHRAARSLIRAVNSGDKAAREDMALASLLGGLALANAGLGAVHGFAAAIGGLGSIPHGEICAALLPHVLKANHERSPGSALRERFGELARILTQGKTSDEQAGLGAVANLCRELRVPGLGARGLDRADHAGICERAQVSSSMKGNPVQFTDRELMTILEEAM